MGAYKYIQKTMQKEYASRDENYKQRLIAMRREPTVTRLEKPTNIARARTLGYKAKQGFVVARVRVTRGSGMQTRPNKGRRPKRMGVNKLTRGKNKQSIAEEKAQRKFENLEVLNSYWIAEDGQHKWFEVIMVDPEHPSIANDANVSWVTSQRNRVYRGKTSAGRKGRGITKKGTGTEKTRPGIRSKKRKGK
ncbi:50S ribosomal protein L15e [archaeon]